MAQQNGEGEQENLWNKILSEASRSVNDRLESKTVLVLGEKNSGKSTLISRLQGLDASEVRKGIALDYSFIDIHGSETDEETIARLNVWQLEGDVEHNHLLKFALNPSTFPNSLVIIALDFSQPWNLSESLHKWLGILQKHVSSVSIQMPPGEHQELKNSLIFDFQNYSNAAAATSSATKTSLKKKRPVEEQSLLPLKDGVLTNNFGVPILVVCCKTDYFAQLEKEYNYNDGHFDYIQQHLRRICLSYGAGLVYTSAKKDKNCDSLLSYIQHVLYGNEMDVKPRLQEKETLFVPIGADSAAKISVDFESQNLTKDPDEPFEDVIRLPKKLQHTAVAAEPMVVAEDDQDFLNRHRETVEKDKAQEAKKPSSGGAASTKEGLLQTLQKFGTSSTENSVAATSASPLVHAKPTAPPSSQSPDKSALPQSLTASIGDSKSGSTNEHQVLSDFFNSLINKDPHRGAPLASSLSRKPDLLKTTTSPSSGGVRSPGGTPNLSSRDDIAKQLEKMKNANKTNQP